MFRFADERQCGVTRACRPRGSGRACRFGRVLLCGSHTFGEVNAPEVGRIARDFRKRCEGKGADPSAQFPSSSAARHSWVGQVVCPGEGGLSVRVDSPLDRHMSESLDSFAWLVLGTDPLWQEFVSPSVGIMSACLDRDSRPDRAGSWPAD